MCEVNPASFPPWCVTWGQRMTYAAEHERMARAIGDGEAVRYWQRIGQQLARQ